MTDQDSHRLTIGALAQATGIGVETLRTWERRYGLANQASRDAGDQRRYSSDEVRRLRLVRHALNGGHRASSVVSLPEEQLLELLNLSANDPPLEAAQSGQWLELVRNWQWRALASELNQRSAEMSAATFLDDHLGPFVREIGRAWADGVIDVSQEHLSSECIMEFLTRRWAALNALNTGPRVVFATLPRERHNLGLHMAAWAMCTANARAVFLGADTPLLDIARTLQMSQSSYLMLSASQSSVPEENSQQLSALKKLLPDATRVVVGGDGFRSVERSDAHYITSFRQLISWFQTT